MASSWNDQAQAFFKMWSDGQRSWLESLARPQAGASSPFAFNPASGVQDAARQINDTWKASIDQWMGMLQDGARLTMPQEHLRKIFDPAEWAKPVPGSFDFGIERIIEGPNFATLWDLDRKLLKVQQLALRRTEDSAAYHTIVLGAWTRAVERFMRALADHEQPALGSFRAIIDLWVKTANDTLIELHRTPEFLEAQRKVTRSATDYRLAEREVAEVYCEMYHIPTRTEVDELARSVHEVRRDIRALARQVQALAENAESPKRAVPRPARKRKASGA